MSTFSIISPKKSLIALGIALGCLGLSLTTAQAKTLDTIVATVNEDVITRSELDGQTEKWLAHLKQNGVALPPQEILEKQIVNQLVYAKLQSQLAEKSGIEIDDTQLNEAIRNKAREDGLTLDQFRVSIEKQGTPFEHYRTEVHKQLMISQLQSRAVRPQLAVSEAEIDSFIRSPAGQDHTGTHYHLSHILLPLPSNPSSEQLKAVRTQAEELASKLKAGADFSKMAVAHSAGQQALKGGDLGWRKASELPSLFAPLVPSMHVGETAGPLRSPSGFHLIKLQDKRIKEGSVALETHARQILIKPSASLSDSEAENQLKTIREKIASGEDFAKLAKKYSHETSTAHKGGDLGWVSENSVVSSFYRRMNLLAPGEVSTPFKTNMGWHLVQVLDRRDQQSTPETVRNRAKQILMERKFEEALMVWLGRLKEDAEVKILL